MNVGSLFSGIGGIERGFELEGFKTEWFVECDLYAQEVLRKNFPGVPIYQDIKKVDWNVVPRVEILTGGFPCQDISIAGAGAGAGITGKRSSLWKEYKKAIGILRPKYAVIENVPELLNKGMSVVLTDLAEMGYDALWFCLQASDFNFSHKRERLFIIANDMRNESPRLFTQYRQEFMLKLNALSRRVLDARHNELPQSPLLGTGTRIPSRVDRIRCIGNSVNTKCAQFVAQIIKEAEV